MEGDIQIKTIEMNVVFLHFIIFVYILVLINFVVDSSRNGIHSY